MRWERPLRIGDEPFVYVVPSGATITHVARDLQAAGLIESALRLELQARWSGASSRIKAGEYALESGLTPVELLDLLVAGTVIQHPFTIVEGWTFHELRRRIAASGVFVHTIDGLSDEEFMTRLGFADCIPKGASSPRPIIFPPAPRTCSFCGVHSMRCPLTSNRHGRGGRRISRCRHRTKCWCSRRLSRGKPEPPRSVHGSRACSCRGCVGACDWKPIRPSSTGLGEGFDGNLRKADLKHDTPYNTYTRKGLPPTPIAIASAAAIDAAIAPVEDGSLYFVAKGDGRHVFSANYEDHRKAVRRYQMRTRRSKRAVESDGG